MKSQVKRKREHVTSSRIYKNRGYGPFKGDVQLSERSIQRYWESGEPHMLVRVGIFCLWLAASAFGCAGEPKHLLKVTAPYSGREKVKLVFNMEAEAT